MKLRPGQVWKVEHDNVIFEGVLVSIFGRNYNKRVLIRNAPMGYILDPENYFGKPMWEFCGFILTQEEAEELFICESTCISAQCIFDPWKSISAISD